MLVSNCHNKLISQNKRAVFDYDIDTKIEAGIVLLGSEVKSLRMSKSSIINAYVMYKKNELFIYGMHIEQINSNINSTRTRKLLLHKSQISKFISQIKEKRFSIIAITLYFNKSNIVKLLLGIGKGRKKYNKLQIMKERDWIRNKSRITKHNIGT